MHQGCDCNREKVVQTDKYSELGPFTVLQYPYGIAILLLDYCQPDDSTSNHSLGSHMPAMLQPSAAWQVDALLSLISDMFLA